MEFGPAAEDCAKHRQLRESLPEPLVFLHEVFALTAQAPC